MSNANAALTPHLAALSIDAAAKSSSICRRTIQREIASGALRAVKIGARVVIRADDFNTWLNGLPMAGSRSVDRRAGR